MMYSIYKLNNFHPSINVSFWRDLFKHKIRSESNWVVNELSFHLLNPEKPPFGLVTLETVNFQMAMQG